MLDRKHAPVVIACLFAGVGAWATKVDVAPSYTYASELFGAGHGAIEYGKAGNPVVTLTIPGDSTGVDTDDADTADVDERITMMGRMHNGEAEITFMLTAGVFDANVSGLMWDADGPPRNDPDQTDAAELAVVCDTGGGTDLGCGDPTAAPGTVASIIDGGRKGDNSITIKIEAATAGGGGDAGSFDTDLTNDNGRNADYMQLITFDLPELDELTALAGATADKPKTVGLLATSRIVSGAFTDGLLTKKTVKGQEAPDPKLVLTGVNAVSVSISDDNEHAIAIDDNEKTKQKAFLHLKGANKAGFVKLADVKIETATERPISEEVKAAPAKAMYSIRTGATTEVTDAADNASFVYSLPSPGKPAVAHEILDLDGIEIDAGLRGTLTITAEGSRSLFNDDDVMFVDYDGDGEMGGSEGIKLDGNMAEGTALSIDPDDTDSFEGGTGTFSVYYMAGGKEHLNHGAMIDVTASVDYSDPSANDEKAVMSTTTLNFDGVGNPVMAYAIPHSTNGTGDKANVRVRCEDAPAAMDEDEEDMCRVFAECWDDMGNRGFGEGPMIAENNVMVANGAAVEAITGLEAMSRISCRVLSKGMVTVQQLTRDGNSGTLVNNTYVGGGM